LPVFYCTLPGAYRNLDKSSLFMDTGLKFCGAIVIK
jgi:hypothetical protein